MMKAEREAINARAKDLVKKGNEAGWEPEEMELKELAQILAKVELECGLIKPVVY